MPPTFLSYPAARRRPAATIAVDCLLPGAALTLAHWREAPTPPHLRDDTSAGSSLRALRAAAPALTGTPYVTANHFDVDAFIGVWSLLNPELALAHEPLLRDVALLGDFRELPADQEAAHRALVLTTWLNVEESRRFYPPFGAPLRREREDVVSARKFGWFLTYFGEVLDAPERFAASWEPEVARIEAARARLRAEGTVRRYPDVGLLVIEAPAPLPYYALFGDSAGYDLVLTAYPGQRYELEQKYTTWVDLESRPTLPRLPLAPLAARLNELERSPRRWTAEPVTDTGPQLRLAGGRTLTKAQRFADPDQRPMHASTIDLPTLEAAVVAYLRAGYAGVAPRRYWTWDDVRAAGARATT